jgi:hypothetical protein
MSQIIFKKINFEKNVPKFSEEKKFTIQDL